MATRPAEAHGRPESGDTLLVIHDFQARSSDELSLAKGDRVQLIERDDEFGDGWFLGKHLVNGNSGLFPEVYTRLAPKNITTGPSAVPTPKPLENAGPFVPPYQQPPQVLPTGDANHDKQTPVSTLSKSTPGTTINPPVTLPLNSTKKDDFVPQITGPNNDAPFGMSQPSNTAADNHVLSETLNVIDEHITDLRSPPSSGGLRAAANDSGSEYSSQMDHRLSYIHGEETDEEEDIGHSKSEVQAWSPDQVAEYLFTTGVEKKHCEVFRDQEISGEVLLGMDQSSLFIKAFDLGSVGRRLKTWQKIKNLQDEVSGLGVPTRRTTQTYGSETGSDNARKTRSRTSTLTSSVRYADDKPLPIQTKRLSTGQVPRLDTAAPLASPLHSAGLDSPTRPAHAKRPSAASIRDLHYSRRHSASTDFRLTGTTVTNTVPPSLAPGSTFPQSDNAHKKQPSFDRNWTLGSAAAQRPLSSAGLNDLMEQHANEVQDAMDADRGYFSGTEADTKRRNVLRKRDSVAHSHKGSYADEQRARSATAISRHSRYGSIDSREGIPSAAAQKYYGIQGNAKRTASTSTSHSMRRVPSAKEALPPTVTKLESTRDSPSAPNFPGVREGISTDWLASVVGKPSVKMGGLRTTSDTVTGDRLRITSPVESSLKDTPVQSPMRTQSSTPSMAQSLDTDQADHAKSSSATMTTASKGARKKGKKETSAYTRGLQKITPQEAVKGADYSGWMRKKSSNLMTTWKPRLFVLRGRRLAYYYSETDDQEKGLIDISFHRVLPADNEVLTGLHATLTGAGSAATHGTSVVTSQANEPPLAKGDESMFIFKLVPPRAGLSRAVTFTKPTVHYFAVPNLQQGRLWMAALVKATIDRDDTQPITTTYQQHTISLAKARAMRHRPPALMNLDEMAEEEKREREAKNNNDVNLLGIHFGEADSGISGLDKLSVPKAGSASAQKLTFDGNDTGFLPPQSA